MNRDGSNQHMVSTGKGRTTCGYFLPDNKHILYASTHEAGDACPPAADRSKGYVWAVYPTYKIYLATDDGKILKTLAGAPGYNAEGTVNFKSGRIVYTSMESGDLDLWTMKPDGSDKKQVTKTDGYDGGPVFSRDGKQMVWRANHPLTPETEKRYHDLLKDNLTSPMKMELFVADGEGKHRKADHEFRMRQFRADVHAGWQEDSVRVEQARLRRAEVRAVPDQHRRHGSGAGDRFRRIHGVSRVCAGWQDDRVRVGQRREVAVRVQYFHGGMEVRVGLKKVGLRWHF